MKDSTEIAVQKNMMALAKKRGSSARSRMLSMIMPHLSQENGEKLASALDSKNSSKFREVWDKIRKEIETKFGHKAEASNSNDFLEEFELEVLASYNDSDDGILLNGSGPFKDQLRSIIANGYAEISPGIVYRLVSIDLGAAHNRALQSNIAKIDAELHRVDGTLIKSFRFSGKLVSAVFDNLLLAKAFIKDDK